MVKNIKTDGILLKRLGFTNPHSTKWIFTPINIKNEIQIIGSEIHFFEEKSTHFVGLYKLLSDIYLN